MGHDCEGMQDPTSEVGPFPPQSLRVQASLPAGPPSSPGNSVALTPTYP
jgi:hypothetical protein